MPALLDLLTTHMSKGRTELHGKVCGLVGISADRDSFGKIDYDRSARETYIYTARYIITSTGSLDVIFIQQNDDNLLKLPLWVTDWERRNLYPAHRVVGLRTRSNPQFKASGSSTANISFSDNGEILVASGLVFDTITTLSKPLYVEGPESDVLPTLAAFHNWWTVFINNIGSTSEDLDVFQRTFCGGSWAPQYSEREFREDQAQRITLFFGLMQRLAPQLLEGEPSMPLPNATIDEADEMREKRERALVSSTALRMHAKRLAISEKKLAGLAPQSTKEDDKIVILMGCNFPVVMRPMNSY